MCANSYFAHVVLEVYVHMCVCGTYHSQWPCMSNGSNITLTLYSSTNIFIALRWCSEMIVGFAKYTYQALLATKPYTYVFLFFHCTLLF